MAARGTLAKQFVGEKIKAAFGADYVGEQDGKHYVWVKENGDKLQIAIALTCPKNEVIIDNTSNEDWDWSDPVTPPEPKKMSSGISKEEEANLQALMDKLGL